jgi:serine/threonine protein kinase
MEPSNNADLNESTQSALYFGNYEVLKTIGKGKFAIVYRAKKIGDDQVVALKRIAVDMMNEKAREKCLKEVRLLQSLDHPNIIRYMDSFITENDLVIVYEWAAAGDLKRQLRKAQERGSGFEERVIWKYFSQICGAMKHMHDKRIMHRDLKPANIFLTLDGTIKVGDLGLSRELSEHTMQAHSKVGTPLYMSPEVLNGEGYDFKSDVWSLGCLLYELAMLKSPFKSEGLNLYSLFEKISKGDYLPLPETFSEELRTLTYSMIATKSEDRPEIGYVCKVAQEMRAATAADKSSKSKKQATAAAAAATAAASATTSTATVTGALTRTDSTVPDGSTMNAAADSKRDTDRNVSRKQQQQQGTRDPAASAHKDEAGPGEAPKPPGNNPRQLEREGSFNLEPVHAEPAPGGGERGGGERGGGYADSKTGNRSPVPIGVQRAGSSPDRDTKGHRASNGEEEEDEEDDGVPLAGDFDFNFANTKSFYRETNRGGAQGKDEEDTGNDKGRGKRSGGADARDSSGSRSGSRGGMRDRERARSRSGRSGDKDFDARDDTAQDDEDDDEATLGLGQADYLEQQALQKAAKAAGVVALGSDSKNTGPVVDKVYPNNSSSYVPSGGSDSNAYGGAASKVVSASTTTTAAAAAAYDAQNYDSEKQQPQQQHAQRVGKGLSERTEYGAAQATASLAKPKPTSSSAGSNYYDYDSGASKKQTQDKRSASIAPAVSPAGMAATEGAAAAARGYSSPPQSYSGSPNSQTSSAKNASVAGHGASNNSSSNNNNNNNISTNNSSSNGASASYRRAKQPQAGYPPTSSPSPPPHASSASASTSATAAPSAPSAASATGSGSGGGAGGTGTLQAPIRQPKPLARPPGPAASASSSAAGGAAVEAELQLGAPADFTRSSGGGSGSSMQSSKGTAGQSNSSSNNSSNNSKRLSEHLQDSSVAFALMESVYAELVVLGFPLGDPDVRAASKDRAGRGRLLPFHFACDLQLFGGAGVAGHDTGYQFMQFRRFLGVVIWLCDTIGGAAADSVRQIRPDESAPVMSAKQVLRAVQVKKVLFLFAV